MYMALLTGKRLCKEQIKQHIMIKELQPAITFSPTPYITWLVFINWADIHGGKVTQSESKIEWTCLSGTTLEYTWLTVWQMAT
jgi:hypothetical protein